MRTLIEQISKTPSQTIPTLTRSQLDQISAQHPQTLLKIRAARLLNPTLEKTTKQLLKNHLSQCKTIQESWDSPASTLEHIFTQTFYPPRSWKGVKHRLTAPLSVHSLYCFALSPLPLVSIHSAVCQSTPSAIPQVLGTRGGSVAVYYSINTLIPSTQGLGLGRQLIHSLLASSSHTAHITLSPISKPVPLHLKDRIIHTLSSCRICVFHVGNGAAVGGWTAGGMVNYVYSVDIVGSQEGKENDGRPPIRFTDRAWEQMRAEGVDPKEWIGNRFFL